jgi:glycosyltransferase involved in cell wall biosynthesis
MTGDIVSESQRPFKKFFLRPYLKVLSSRLVKAVITSGKQPERDLIKLGLKDKMIIGMYPSYPESFCDVKDVPEVFDMANELLYVGRISGEKGVFLFPEILKQIKATGIRLNFIGTGPDEDKLYRIFEDENLQDSVRFLGYKDSLMLCSYMSRCKLLLLPSLMDALCMVSVEGTICGIPAVAFRTGGIPDNVIDGENGYIVETNDTESFALKVDEILMNNQLWHKMHNKAISLRPKYMKLGHTLGEALKPFLESIN